MIKNQIFFICLSCIISGCITKDRKPIDKEIIPVKVMVVPDSSEEAILPYSGTLVPYKSVNFGFMVSGKVKQVYIEEGKYVNQGQLIAELVSIDYSYALDAAEAQYERATKEYDRLKKLYDKNSLTQSDYDKITALYKEAKADYEYKKKQLNDTRLYSPDDGWISFDNVQPGEIVKQGLPVFQLIHTNKVFVKVMIPENEISVVEIGKKIMVRIPSVNDTMLEATIKRIAPQAESFSRSFKVKALIENTGFIIKPGMIAHVSIPSGQIEQQIMIPARAVIRSANGETYVYIIKDNVAAKQNVRTGLVSGSQLIITYGLDSGDTIVTEGGIKLYEGAEIEIIKNEN